jgi:chromosome partitioning protein
MKVITLLNEKGGCGKTTASVTLAAGLALRGGRVLLIDSDPQAHATASLRLPERDSLYRLLVQEADWANEKQDSRYWITLRVDPKLWAGRYAAQGALHVLPSSGRQIGLPMALGSDPQGLRYRLDEIREEIDVVVVDTSPLPSPVHTWVYLASDYVIYPTQPEYLSLKGLKDSTEHMKVVAETRKRFGLPEAVTLGVLPMMYERRSNHKANMKILEKHLKTNIWMPIRRRILWAHAVQAGRSIFAYCGKSQAGRQPDAEFDAWAFVNRVIEEIN